ncbi:MAG: chemotaxis protein [Xanthobacteraceae bacterium]
MGSQISLALLASAINTAVASAFATFLTFGVASAVTQQFGTAEEARAMLDRAAAALKSDETKALRDFNDTKNKLYHDRDLYISCFNTSKFTAFPGPGMVGMDVRSFKLGDDPIGQRAFDVVQATQEGTISTMDYNFPKAGKPAVKQSLQTRVGSQGCGVSFYK